MEARTSAKAAERSAEEFWTMAVRRVECETGRPFGCYNAQFGLYDSLASSSGIWSVGRPRDECFQRTRSRLLRYCRAPQGEDGEHQQDELPERCEECDHEHRRGGLVGKWELHHRLAL